MMTATTKSVLVDATKWRDAVKFLMGLGTNPSLTGPDMKFLRKIMSDMKLTESLTEVAAAKILESVGWVKASASSFAAPNGRN